MKQEFLQRMENLLQAEYPLFEASLSQPFYRGVRFNPLKIDEEHFLELFPYILSHTPFCEEGFYLPQDAMHIGNHPLHASGAIYLQEPSAAAPVTILDVQEGDCVLDLCAAPGGKSTQIAARLGNSGLLMANEYDAKRAQILLSNMERMGFGEAIITNAHPHTIAETCAGWFDKVLVDAPCSGEGMMKKHDAADADWSVAQIEMCAERQIQILHDAFTTLKENGILVYSTCTYAPEENEMVVARILRERDDIEQVDMNVSFGRCGFAYPGMNHHQVRRIFPMDGGEGHFIAKFRKCKGGITKRQKTIKTSGLTSKQRTLLHTWLKEKTGYYHITQNKLYYRMAPFLDMGNIKVLRQGILCGEWEKNRIEPHQHIWMSPIFRDCFSQIYECNDTQWLAFQRGEELAVAGYRGYVAIAWHNLIVGFGKGDGVVIKNKYPKGLRKPNVSMIG